jgi:hypothetical protein
MRLIGVERLTRVLGCRHRGQNLAWIWCALVIEDVAAHTRPMYTSDLRMMRISDDRSRETNLGFRERGRITK